MLLQIKNFRFWMQAKMGQRGAALVEYAILLAFVAVIGAAFIGSSDGTLAGNITKIVTKIKDLLAWMEREDSLEKKNASEYGYKTYTGIKAKNDFWSLVAEGIIPNTVKVGEYTYRINRSHWLPPV